MKKIYLVCLCFLLILFAACSSQKKVIPPNEIVTGASEPVDPTDENYSDVLPIKKISDRGTFLRIQKGRAEGVNINDRFHIFSEQKKGFGKHIADAKVVAVRSQEAFLRVEKLHQPIRIRVGFLAKRLKLANP